MPDDYKYAHFLTNKIMTFVENNKETYKSILEEMTISNNIQNTKE